MCYLTGKGLYSALNLATLTSVFYQSLKTPTVMVKQPPVPSGVTGSSSCQGVESLSALSLDTRPPVKLGRLLLYTKARVSPTHSSGLALLRRGVTCSVPRPRSSWRGSSFLSRCKVLQRGVGHCASGSLQLLQLWGTAVVHL